MCISLGAVFRKKGVMRVFYQVEVKNAQTVELMIETDSDTRTIQIPSELMQAITTSFQNVTAILEEHMIEQSRISIENEYQGENQTKARF